MFGFWIAVGLAVLLVPIIGWGLYLDWEARQ